MEQTVFGMAGLTVSVMHQYQHFKTLAADFLTECDRCDIAVNVTEDDIDTEREYSRTEARHEGRDCPNYSPAYLETTAIYRKIANILPAFGGFVFHGSAVAVDGKAYLFTAPSGTGKTTHTRLWMKVIPGCTVVNGDKPVLRLTDGNVYVCATPWKGKEKLGGTDDLPLQAICLLHRHAENTVRPTTFSQAMPTLIGQSYRPTEKEPLIATLKLIEAVGTQVALYDLYCNMEEDAARVAYREVCR